MGIRKYGRDTITLGGEEVPLGLAYVPQVELRYYPENPRIYTILKASEKEPTQREIEEQLLSRDYVKQLILSIKANDGLMEPLLVLDKSLIVLEGNSRLAALRFLASKDPIKWNEVKCKLLPPEVDEDKIFALLGEYHIVGRQDWVPYEQAGYLYRRHIIHNVKIKQMSKELGLTMGKIKKFISIYSFMVENFDNRPERWSFYEQYLTKNILKKARQEYDRLDNLVISMIKRGKIRKAADIRDLLPLIFKANKKVINNFLGKKYDFYEAVERAKSGGADEHNFQKLKSFRKWIANKNVHNEFEEMPSRIQDRCLYQIKKIAATLRMLERRLK